MNYVAKYYFLLISIFFLLLISDVPNQMPPLTPGTNKKLTEVLKQSFASWEKELQNCNITKGNYYQFYYDILNLFF